MTQEITVYEPEAQFNLAWRAAQAFAGSSLIPQDMRTRENCMVAILLADEMGESRLSVIQNLFSVHGRFGWITAYMVSRANRSGKLLGPIRWNTISKDPLEVECYANLRDAPEDDRRVSVTIDLQTAVDSGWTTYKDKAGKIQTHARWATPIMQEQMLRWRTASWLIRLYLPETMMGLPTKEELEDISDREMVDVTPALDPPKLADFAPESAALARAVPKRQRNKDTETWEAAQAQGAALRARQCDKHHVVDCPSCKEQNPPDGPEAHSPAVFPPDGGGSLAAGAPNDPHVDAPLPGSADPS